MKFANPDSDAETLKKT